MGGGGGKGAFRDCYGGGGGRGLGSRLQPLQPSGGLGERGVRLDQVSLFNGGVTGWMVLRLSCMAILLNAPPLFLSPGMLLKPPPPLCPPSPSP